MKKQKLVQPHKSPRQQRGGEPAVRPPQQQQQHTGVPTAFVAGHAAIAVGVHRHHHHESSSQMGPTTNGNNGNAHMIHNRGNAAWVKTSDPWIVIPEPTPVGVGVKKTRTDPSWITHIPEPTPVLGVSKRHGKMGPRATTTTTTNTRPSSFVSPFARLLPAKQQRGTMMTTAAAAAAAGLVKARDVDILMGSGRQNYGHPGNVRFRECVAQYHEIHHHHQQQQQRHRAADDGGLVVCDRNRLTQQIIAGVHKDGRRFLKRREGISSSSSSSSSSQEPLYEEVKDPRVLKQFVKRLVSKLCREFRGNGSGSTVTSTIVKNQRKAPGICHHSPPMKQQQQQHQHARAPETLKRPPSHQQQRSNVGRFGPFADDSKHGIPGLSDVASVGSDEAGSFSDFDVASFSSASSHKDDDNNNGKVVGGKVETPPHPPPAVVWSQTPSLLHRKLASYLKRRQSGGCHSDELADA